MNCRARWDVEQSEWGKIQGIWKLLQLVHFVLPFSADTWLLFLTTVLSVRRRVVTNQESKRKEHSVFCLFFSLQPVHLLRTCGRRLSTIWGNGSGTFSPDESLISERSPPFKD